ncbi:MAG: VOC family protein [Dehalococcoidia bacterium]
MPANGRDPAGATLRAAGQAAYNRAMKIALTSVYVDDPMKAYAFYTDVLGFIGRLHIPEANLAIVVSAEEPDGAALLLEPNDHPIAAAYQAGIYQAELPAIVFGTSDIHADYQRLTARGVVFRSEPAVTDWGTQAVFEDTCGNLIQLHQP